MKSAFHNSFSNAVEDSFGNAAILIPPPSQTLNLASFSGSFTGRVYLIISTVGLSTINHGDGSSTPVNGLDQLVELNYVAASSPVIQIENAQNIRSLNLFLNNNFIVLIANLNLFTSLNKLMISRATISGDISNLNMPGLQQLNLGDQRDNLLLTGDLNAVVQSHAGLRLLAIRGGNMIWQNLTIASIYNGLVIYLEDNDFTNSEIDLITQNIQGVSANLSTLWVFGNNGIRSAASNSAWSVLNSAGVDLRLNKIPMPQAVITGMDQVMTKGAALSPNIVISFPGNPTFDLVTFMYAPISSGISVSRVGNTVEISGTPGAGLPEEYYEIGVRCVGNGLWSGQQDITVAINFDKVNPVLTNPVDIQTGSTTASLSIDTDKIGGNCIVVVSQSTTKPSYAQALLGRDHSDNDAAFTATQVVTSVGTKNFTATGLSPNTQYYAHFFHRDDHIVPNDAPVTSGDGFTTQQAPTLNRRILINFSGNIGSGNANWNEALNTSAIGDLIDDQGNATGISMTLSGVSMSNWLGENVSLGGHPNNVAFHAALIVSSGSFVFSGLNNAYQYRLHFGSTLSGSPTGRSADFTWGSQTKNNVNPASDVYESFETENPNAGSISLVVSNAGTTPVNMIMIEELIPV